MKVFIPLVFALWVSAFSSLDLFADCTGCCSGHGGVVCSGGVTKCADGTTLSTTCVNKGCNVCTDLTTTTISPTTSTTSSITTSTISTTTSTAGTTSTTTSQSVTTTTTKPPQYQLFFPQIADGGGYKTTVLLTNRSDTATTATASFFNSQGSPLVLTVGQEAASSFSVDLPARGSASIITAGIGSSASTGWAGVSTSPAVDVNGNAIFQLFDAGSLFSEASVPSAILTSSVDFYADEEGGFSTGFAIANPLKIPATGTLTLRKKDGSIVGTSPINILPGSHAAGFLFQLFPVTISGKAEISLTSGMAAITALRYHTSSVFSTVSVGQTTVSALFSPAGGVRSRIVSEIDKANSTIDIAIYSFTADEIREALIRAKNRGVAIRIIADSSQANGQGSEIATLEQAGFNLKRMAGLNGGIMHNKYMIIDGLTLLTGSYNWSANAENNSFENAAFVQGLPVILSYQENFESIWNR